MLQTWARNGSASGAPTGIDIPGEFDGLVPGRQVAQRAATPSTATCVKTRRAAPSRPARRCSSAAASSAPWSRRRQRQPLRRPGRPAGHAAADGRRLRDARQRRHRRAPAPRPRDRGRPGHADRQASTRPPRRKVDDLRARRATTILEGLRARGDGGRRHLGARLQRLRPVDTVYGKTGTAERAGRTPTSPGTSPTSHDPNRARSSSSATIEKGGFGAETAAPAACHILAKHWFDLGRRARARRRGTTPTTVE